MADKRITNLPFKTDLTLSDEMHINDVVSNFDKKILISVLRTLLSIPYMQVSLSNYDNDSAPAVKQGSSFDSKGVPTDIASDLTPTGYSGISNSTTFYLYWDESAGAFIYSETVPTWTDLYQGWYTGDDRALFSMYKDSGGTLYQNKNLLLTQNNLKVVNNLTIGNDLIVNNNSIVSGYATFSSKRITSASFVYDSGINEGALFTKISAFLPDIGDIMLVTGAVKTGSGDITISRIKRTASNSITIYGFLSGAITSIEYFEGSGSTLFPMSFAW